MKALVIGQGGREHALVRALRLSPSIQEVHVLPGSDGMVDECIRHRVDWQNFAAVDELIVRHGIQLVVIGPEVPLAAGLSDALRANGRTVFGPSRQAAQLEASKIFSKRFMREAGVATADSVEVQSVDDVTAAIHRFQPPYVLKADGLAAGKGVFICKSKDELLAAAHTLFVEKSLGSAGRIALLEEFQPGYEISYLILTNGETWEPLILAADHKRLGDNDQGPNTGGMGTVAPLQIDPALRERIGREVFTPVIRQLKESGLFYRGVLYAGLMITEKGPSVLEFNVRFGDPEAQVILPLLDGDWGKVLHEVAQGRVPKLKWKGQAAACVVLAAEGYPDDPVKDAVIEGELQVGANADGAYFLHAGTARHESGTWVTAGGRVLNAIGLGQDIPQALRRAYGIADHVGWLGMQMRRDIGKNIRSAGVTPVGSGQ